MSSLNGHKLFCRSMVIILKGKKTKSYAQEESCVVTFPVTSQAWSKQFVISAFFVFAFCFLRLPFRNKRYPCHRRILLNINGVRKECSIGLMLPIGIKDICGTYTSVPICWDCREVSGIGYLEFT